MTPTTRDLYEDATMPRTTLMPCPDCEDGEVRWNPSWDQDPQREDSAPCKRCGGTGEVRA